MNQTWQKAWELSRQTPDYLDLIDSRFHQNGLTPPREVFERSFSRWLDARCYDPDSRGALSARIALQNFYSTEGLNLPVDSFFLTAGTSESYALLFSTLAEAGDSVALPRPGYPLFEHLANHTRLKTVFYDQPARDRWQPDVESLTSCLTPRTKFVVVISPNNPTGQVVSASVLEKIAEVCRKNDLILIVDEVFDACFEGPGRLPRPGALFPDVKTFTLNGISKRFGSPDLKLAWIAVSGPDDWVAQTNKKLELANDTFLSANSWSQFLLPDLFTNLGPWQQRVRDQLTTNRAVVAQWLSEDPRVSGVLPAGGIHGIWQFKGLPEGWDDEAWAVMLLKTEQLGLHPGFFYDVEEPGIWLVYSLLKEPQAFREGLRRLQIRFNSVVLGPSGLR